MFPFSFFLASLTSISVFAIALAEAPNASDSCYAADVNPQLQHLHPRSPIPPPGSPPFITDTHRVPQHPRLRHWSSGSFDERDDDAVVPVHDARDAASQAFTITDLRPRIIREGAK